MARASQDLRKFINNLKVKIMFEVAILIFIFTIYGGVFQNVG
jgi:hypothetical protein